MLFNLLIYVITAISLFAMVIFYGLSKSKKMKQLEKQLQDYKELSVYWLEKANFWVDESFKHKNECDASKHLLKKIEKEKINTKIDTAQKFDEYFGFLVTLGIENKERFERVKREWLLYSQRNSRKG